MEVERDLMWASQMVEKWVEGTEKLMESAWDTLLAPLAALG